MGVGALAVCEVAIQAARRFVDSMATDQLVVKLDFTTLSTVYIDLIMLLAVKERLSLLEVAIVIRLYVCLFTTVNTVLWFIHSDV